MRIRSKLSQKLPPRGIIVGSIVAIAFLMTTAVLLEALIRPRLGQDTLSTPTRFYARPLVLEVGMTVDRDAVESRLKRLGYDRSRRRSVRIGEYRLSSRQWNVGRRAFRLADKLDPGGVVTVDLGYGGYITSIQDADNRRLRYFTIEPELLRSAYGPKREDRVPIQLSDLPPHLVDAVLSIEDQRFYTHSGIDIKRVLGAAFANIRARRVVQGGSTITQQLVKNLYLSSRRSPVRKLREAAMALVFDSRYDKGQILETYLNQVYLGQNGGLAIHGVGRAAQYFFGKDVSQLTLSEAALLAGIIRGPSLYSPFRNPEAATDRRNLVLSVMGSRGLLTERQVRDAQGRPLGLRSPPKQARTGRYVADYVASRLRSEHGDKALKQGLTVFTTVDMALQSAAEQAVTEGLARLDREYPRLAQQDSPLQAALVAIKPQTGEILAMVGGRDYGETQFNRAVYARRQPGSSFKPIVALTALTANSQQFTLASLLEDKRLSVETPVGLWEPENYDQRFRGEVTLRDALERSLNVPFARLGMAVGPERIAETGGNLGIENDLYAVPSLALGSSEVSPLEMSRAYGVFAAGGFRAELHSTLGVIDRDGDVLSRAKIEGQQVYDPAEVYLITSALQGAVERGTGRGLRSLGYRGPVAAKSGTTNGFRDAWFIGYTPDIAVAVWVGFDDGRSIGLSGSRAALPIFARFLVSALGRYGGDDFEIPPGIEVADINEETGLLAGPGCRGEPEVFLRGTAPRRSCSPYWESARRFVSGNTQWYEPVLRELRRKAGRER